MNTNPLVTKLRAKKLGILIQNARQTAGKDLEACSQYLNIPAGNLEAYEYGEVSPSMPELEALSNYLEVPLEHFWQDRLLPPRENDHKPVDTRLVQLRQKVIGVLLQQARQQAGLSLDLLAAQTGIDSLMIEKYEGGAPIPLPELEALSANLQIALGEFKDKDNPMARKTAELHESTEFMTLPEELRRFICKPINRPFLELAQRLSDLPAEKLRAVAESLLEITL